MESPHFFFSFHSKVIHSTTLEIIWGKLVSLKHQVSSCLLWHSGTRSGFELFWFPSRNSAEALHLYAPLKNIFTIDFPPTLIYHLTPSIMRFVGWFLRLSGNFFLSFFFFFVCVCTAEESRVVRQQERLIIWTRKLQPTRRLHQVIPPSPFHSLWFTSAFITCQ